jgi:hypothetical protein
MDPAPAHPQTLLINNPLFLQADYGIVVLALSSLTNHCQSLEGCIVLSVFVTILALPILLPLSIIMLVLFIVTLPVRLIVWIILIRLEV